MKHIGAILLIFIATSSIIGQKIQEIGRSAVYIIPAIPFTMKIIEVKEHAQYQVKSDYGRIERKNDSIFEVNFDSIGYYSIDLVDQLNQVVYTKEGLVQSYLKPNATFGRKVKGSLERSQFKAEQGIWARVRGLDMSANHPIIYFEYTIFRNETVKWKGFQFQGKFDDLLRFRINKMNPGDEIYFHSIYTVLPGESVHRELNTISIKMK